MKIKLSWQYFLAFMAFVFVAGQLHELAHLIAAYVVCGHPGTQVDFNLWTLCDGCNLQPDSWLPTVFGPVFSYLLIWAGYFMLCSSNKERWPVAFVLIMGNLAFARLFTASMGKGDETTVLKVLFTEQPLWLIKLSGFVLVSALTFPPLYMVYKRIANKRGFLITIVFCIAPLLIMMPYEFMLLGSVLKSGVLNQRWLLGVPALVYLHTGLMAVIVILFAKTLFQASAKSIT
ncbi:hypothetical protein [Mucilaginibacter segetis]|uniref:Peptidase M50B-like protein n=1 Tax=Mucilaginibacter segetis TaxID=2793071 RepID=A0A934PWD0_9SPHI|nr:hypothetical protein [Mucilaginibacter segetis]MBK0380625.1 hypothetical protein [Mucilaginibacter segetis]